MMETQWRMREEWGEREDGGHGKCQVSGLGNTVDTSAITLGRNTGGTWVEEPFSAAAPLEN